MTNYTGQTFILHFHQSFLLLTGLSMSNGEKTCKTTALRQRECIRRVWGGAGIVPKERAAPGRDGEWPRSILVFTTAAVVWGGGGFGYIYPLVPPPLACDGLAARTAEKCDRFGEWAKRAASGRGRMGGCHIRCTAAIYICLNTHTLLKTNGIQQRGARMRVPVKLHLQVAILNGLCLEVREVRGGTGLNIIRQNITFNCIEVQRISFFMN